MQPPITKISMIISYLEFHSDLPGVNELTSLTHSNLVMPYHVNVNRVIIDACNGLSPAWCQACAVNTLRLRQNGCHFAGDSFKQIFLNENVGIAIKISLKFVPEGPVNNISALVQIMAWRRPGDKSFSETILVRSLMLICITRPQWVNETNADFLPVGLYNYIQWSYNKNTFLSQNKFESVVCKMKAILLWTVATICRKKRFDLEPLWSALTSWRCQSRLLPDWGIVKMVAICRWHFQLHLI